MIRCPRCLSHLQSEVPAQDEMRCTGCEARWPVRFGIADLRDHDVDDPYLSRDEDLRAAERLASAAERSGFKGALAAYYETNARVPAAQAQRFIAGTLGAESRARAMLEAWQTYSGSDDRGTLVDLGCGTGPLMAAAGSKSLKLIGVDVGLRWLVLAAARLRERQVDAVLVCAGVHRLPFADASVDIVASEALLENAPPARQVIAESARVLRPGGWLCLTTANRWSLGPDPHVGLPLGGWLPGDLVTSWARRRGMVPPKRQLLGARDLRRLIGSPSYERLRIGPTPIAESQRAAASTPVRAAVDVYRAASRWSIGREALSAVGPVLLAVARRTKDYMENTKRPEHPSPRTRHG